MEPKRPFKRIIRDKDTYETYRTYIEGWMQEAIKKYSGPALTLPLPTLAIVNFWDMPCYLHKIADNTLLHFKESLENQHRLEARGGPLSNFFF